MGGLNIYNIYIYTYIPCDVSLLPYRLLFLQPCCSSNTSVCSSRVCACVSLCGYIVTRLKMTVISETEALLCIVCLIYFYLLECWGAAHKKLNYSTCLCIHVHGGKNISKCKNRFRFSKEAILLDYMTCFFLHDHIWDISELRRFHFCKKKYVGKYCNEVWVWPSHGKVRWSQLSIW